MVNRIVSVDETFNFPTRVRAALLDALGAGSPGRPLAVTVHNPTTQAEYSNPAGTTFTALAPAVLQVTFTAPASGNFVVDLEGHVNVSGQRGYWALMNGSAVVCPTMACGVVTEGDGLRARVRLHVTDLTPGQSYSMQWAAAATGSFTLRAGGAGSLGTANSGPATMTVWAAP